MKSLKPSQRCLLTGVCSHTATEWKEILYHLRLLLSAKTSMWGRASRQTTLTSLRDSLGSTKLLATTTTQTAAILVLYAATTLRYGEIMDGGTDE